MPTLDCRTDRRGGLTLVECTVHNDTADRRRVRLENRLDGPIRAPPADDLGPAWTDGTATCLLAPGERAALGYASPAPPSERPVGLTHEVVERGGDGERAFSETPTVPAPRPPEERRDGAVDADEPLRPDGAGIALPPAVAAWLSALEGRIEAIESGNRDRPTGHATVVVDRETLAALERRAGTLEERLAAVRAAGAEIS